MVSNLDRVIDVVYTYKVTPYRETSDKKHNFLKISFTDFLALMRKTSICIDPRTAKAKWETLIAKDIFMAGNPPSKTAFIDLEMLSTLGYECDLLPSNPNLCKMGSVEKVAEPSNIYTHTTHTQESRVRGSQ